MTKTTKTAARIAEAAAVIAKAKKAPNKAAVKRTVDRMVKEVAPKAKKVISINDPKLAAHPLAQANAASWPKAKPTTTKGNRFLKGSGAYICSCCARKTRATGQGDNEHVKLCAECYLLAGEENHLSDSGKLYDVPSTQAALETLVARGKDTLKLFPTIVAALKEAPKTNVVKNLEYITGLNTATPAKTAPVAEPAPAKHTATNVPPVVALPEALFPQFVLAYGKALKALAVELKNDWKQMGAVHYKVLTLLGDYLRGGCGVDPVTTGSWLTVHSKTLTTLVRAYFGYTAPAYTPPKAAPVPKTERAVKFAAEQAAKEAAAGDTGARVKDLNAARERNRLQEEAKAAAAAKAAEEKAAKKAAGKQPQAPSAPANKKAQAKAQPNPTNTVYAGVALSPNLVAAVKQYAAACGKKNKPVAMLEGKLGSAATMHLGMKKLVQKNAAKLVSFTALGLKVAAEVK